MPGINKQFIYNTLIEWQGQKKGVLFSAGKPNIEVATPPEFHGHAGIWSPEDLLVASVNSCIMTTFLYYSQRNNIHLLGYKSEASGILEMQKGKLVFSMIKIQPEIMVNSQEDYEKAKEFISKTEASCLISNSINFKVKVIAEIKIKE